MTYDTDEHSNVPYKISISSENITEDYVKQHFEKGLSDLLADPYFLLLYVPENGAKMQIIQPAKDSYHQKRIEKRISEAKGIPSFYYALSHLWKITENNRHLWEEIGEYVDGLDGKPVAAVSMRREKRETLLGLLKDHPDSYWWIDVLCARSDTPLDIMGNIYSCCLECIAMIDCEPTLLSKFHTEKNMRRGLYDEDYCNELLSSESSSDYLLHSKQIYEKYPELIKDLYAFRQSEWWNRVWTLQEMALPFGVVRLMAETDIDRFQSNTIAIDDLLNTFEHAMEIILYMKDKDEYDPEIHKLLYCWFKETFYSRGSKAYILYMAPEIRIPNLIFSLSGSLRRCMDPVDYVYGVLGVLQIKIPRETDPKKVWQRFLSEIDYMDTKLVGIREDAYEIDLTTVDCMGDVYGDILDIEDVE